MYGTPPPPPANTQNPKPNMEGSSPAPSLYHFIMLSVYRGWMEGLDTNATVSVAGGSTSFHVHVGECNFNRPKPSRGPQFKVLGPGDENRKMVNTSLQHGRKTLQKTCILCHGAGTTKPKPTRSPRLKPNPKLHTWKPKSEEAQNLTPCTSKLEP